MQTINTTFFTEAQLLEAFESNCTRLLQKYAADRPTANMREIRELAFKCFKSGAYSLREVNELSLFEDICYRHFAGAESATGFACPANIFMKRDGEYVLKFVELGYFCFTRARVFAVSIGRSKQ